MIWHLFFIDFTYSFKSTNLIVSLASVAPQLSSGWNLGSAWGFLWSSHDISLFTPPAPWLSIPAASPQSHLHPAPPSHPPTISSDPNCTLFSHTEFHLVLWRCHARSCFRNLTCTVFSEGNVFSFLLHWLNSSCSSSRSEDGCQSLQKALWG